MDRSVRRHHSSPGSSASASPRQGPLSLRGAECLPTVLPWTPLPWNTSDSETSVLCPGPPWCCRRAPAAVESTLRWCGHQRGAWCPPSRCRPCCPARVHRMPRLRSRTSPDGRQRVTRLLLPVSQLRRIPQYSVHSRRVRSKLPEERGVGDRMESLLFPFSLGADSARHSRVLLFWSPVRSAMAACLGASGICRVCPWCAQHSLPGGKSFSMGSALIRWTALPKLGEARPAFTLRRGRARWGCVGYPAANSLVIR